MEQEISRKPVTPIGDFNCQSFPLIEGNTYEITDEELEKLGKHELKWSAVEYEATEDILDDEGNLTGQRQITKTRPILIPNDPTGENARNLAIQRIAELQELLAKTDYIVTKIAEAETEEEKATLRGDEVYAAKLRLRKAWRAEINELEGILTKEE